MQALGLGRIDILMVLKKCKVIQILGASVGEDFHYRIVGNTADEKGVILRIKLEKQPPDIDQVAVISVRCIDKGRESHEEMPKVRVEFKK